ncbi:unnamed protein product [Symbiodinium sp. CCMP2456]|nr:unnamed protein product [Symbiodinium sp. CCMP2456]
MADEESEAETIPGAFDESVPVSSTQLARRSLWKKAESGGPGTGNGGRGHGSRRYQRLQPHMKTMNAQTIDVPAECRRSHSTGLAQQIRYIPVDDPRESLSYMMCSFCTTDRIFEQVPALLQHMQSGECPLGQKELMQPTCFGEPAPSGPVPWAADSREASQRDMEGQSAQSGPRRNETPSEGFALRRKMLSEMRLLQPFRYAELATEPVGLLNRSVQELSILVQAARNRPEGSGEPEANMRSKGRALGSRRMAKGPQRSFVEALASRLRSQGTSMKCPFTFAQYRAFCDVGSQLAAEAGTAQDTKGMQSC